jgi:polysaccharide biosynthesis transport protein
MRELAPSYNRPLAARPEQEAEIFAEVVSEDEEFHLRDHWRVVRKHRWRILCTFFGTVLIVGAAIYTKAPIYKATATLLIERQAPQMLDIHTFLAPEPVGPDEYDYYQTQFEILKSPSLAAKVIREERLEKQTWFAGADRKAPRSNFQNLGENARGPGPRLIDAYLRSLEIEPVPRTRLVKVSFSTPDPDLSARVANAHAEAYINQGVELHLQATKAAQSYLDDKLSELRERVKKSEAALNSYGRDEGIISLNDKENIVVERLADLNKRVTEAEADRIGLEAQASLIHNRDYNSLPAVINSTLIQTLKSQLARDEEEYASLSSQFTSHYSRMAELEAQLDETRRRLKDEIQKVVEGIQSAYLAAQAKEGELRAKMEEQKTAAFGLKDAAVKYAILKREVNTNQQLYDSVLQRIKEIGVATEGQISNVSVIDQAVPPLRPSKPNKRFDLGLSGLAGLMGGLGLAFIFEYFDSTLKTPKEVERYLRLANLAVIPDFATIDDERNYTRDALMLASHTKLPAAPKATILSRDRHLMLVTEAYRILHTNLLLSRAGEPPKTILFTSSAQGEGKTFTTLNTAVTFTEMGARVLVIDADLRHSSCHRVLSTTNGLGLTEVLTGQRDLPEMIRSLPNPFLFLLSSGSHPPNPVAILGSKKMRDILAGLRVEYDYILIDAPPVMPVADAILLSAMVDGVVLVVNSQQTPNYVVKDARARLSRARAKLLGVVLNQVDMRNGDYAHYYQQYCTYHHDGMGEASETARGSS